MCHSEPPTGVRNPYRDALQRIAVGISHRFAPRNYKLLCIIHAYPELRLSYFGESGCESGSDPCRRGLRKRGYYKKTDQFPIDWLIWLKNGLSLPHLRRT